MDTALNRLFDTIRAHMAVLCTGIGIGLYRCAHEWPIWFSETHCPIVAPGTESTDFFLVVDAGKIIGVMLYIALCYLWDKRRTSSALLVLPSAVLVAGYSIPLTATFGADVPTTVLAASLIGCGIGAGMLFSQWIEVCGHLSPLKTIEALAISYLARFLMLPVITNCTPSISAMLIIVLAGTSFIQITYCYRTIGSSAMPVRMRTLPPRRAGTGYGVLFIWACVFTFAFGLGEGRTSLSHAVAISGMGYAIPSLLIAVLAFRLADRFDRSLLYAISIPLMAAGLASIEFFGASAAFSQVLVSAGMCAFELLTYTTACIYAFNTRTSSMFAGSCIRVLALVSADVAVVLVRLVPGTNPSFLIAIATLAVIAMGFVMFLPQVSERLEQRRLISGPSGAPGIDSNGRAEQKAGPAILANHAGLSPRETTVFALLAEGKTTAQISDELFISNGAVRAHCSRIYGKCGVHTRKELDELLSRMG